MTNAITLKNYDKNLQEQDKLTERSISGSLHKSDSKKLKEDILKIQMKQHNQDQDAKTPNSSNMDPQKVIFPLNHSHIQKLKKILRIS